MIRARAGGTFTIELDAIPAAGYVWEPELPSGSATLVERTVHGANPERVGGSGRERFVFKAAEPGEYTIRMRLRRRWEVAPLREETFRLQVR